MALHGAIEQGDIEGVSQGAVVFRADTVNKQVGIKARCRDQRQHAPCQSIDSDHRPASITQGIKSRLLHRYIQVQGKVCSGAGVVTLKYPQNPAMRIGLYVLIAHFTVQNIFVVLLYTHLANMKRTPVIYFVQIVTFLLVNPPHVTQSVREQLAMGVVTKQSGVHNHAGHTVAIHRKAGPLIFGQVKAQGHGLVGAAPLTLLMEFFQVQL